MSKLLSRILAASAAVIVLCAAALLVNHYFFPRQPLLAGDIYYPLVIPDCGEGTRRVAVESDGLSVYSCEAVDVDPNPYPVTRREFND